MKKLYFTRKNLIEIALVLSFFIFFFFVFATVDANHTIFAANNPVEQFYLALRLPPIKAGFTGYVTALLLVTFMTLADIIIIFLRRLSKFKYERFFSFKWISLSVVAVIICLALSLGLGMIYLAANGSTIAPLLSLITSALFVTTLLSIFIGAIIFAIASIFINFRNIDKPYRFFNVAEMVEIEEKIDESELREQVAQDNLASRFGEDLEATVSSVVTTGATTAVGTVTTKELAGREKVFPGLSSIDVEFSGFVADRRKETNITLDALSQEFRLYLAAEEKLYFDLKSIRFFISSLATSRLIILEGLSGTGKSSLPRYFAKFIAGQARFIPVQTTWRDKSSLIGYFNDFNQTFNETEFLKGLYRATYDQDQINLMVLDEFNIARVEYYFADFLSILEYPTHEQRVSVMQLPVDFTPPTHLQDGVLQIEPNTFFICTANKDDSTYSISDKVYDRAIILDFDDRNIPFVAESKTKNIPIGFTELNKKFKAAKETKDYQLTNEELRRFTVITDFVSENLDLSFGNRVFNQITQFVPVYVASGGTKEEALDFLFARKILFKVQGRYEDYIKAALINLEKLLTKQYGSKAFGDSKQLIAKIIRRL